MQHVNGNNARSLKRTKDQIECKLHVIVARRRMACVVKLAAARNAPGLQRVHLKRTVRVRQSDACIPDRSSRYHEQAKLPTVTSPAGAAAAARGLAGQCIFEDALTAMYTFLMYRGYLSRQTVPQL